MTQQGLFEERSVFSKVLAHLSMQDLVNLLYTNKALFSYLAPHVWSSTQYWPDIQTLIDCPEATRAEYYARFTKQLRLDSFIVGTPPGLAFPNLEAIKLVCHDSRLPVAALTQLPHKLLKMEPGPDCVLPYYQIMAGLAVKADMSPILEVQVPRIADLTDWETEGLRVEDYYYIHKHTESPKTRPFPDMIELLVPTKTIERCKVPHYNVHSQTLPAGYANQINTTLKDLCLVSLSDDFAGSLNLANLCRFRSLKKLTLDGCVTRFTERKWGQADFCTDSRFRTRNKKPPFVTVDQGEQQLNQLVELHADGYFSPANILSFTHMAPNLAKLYLTGWYANLYETRYCSCPCEQTQVLWSKVLQGVRVLCFDWAIDRYEHVPLLNSSFFSAGWPLLFQNSDYPTELPSLERIEFIFVRRGGSDRQYRGFEVLDISECTGLTIPVTVDNRGTRERVTARLGQVTLPNLQYLGPHVRVIPERRFNLNLPPSPPCTCDAIRACMPRIDPKRVCGHCVAVEGNLDHQPDAEWFDSYHSMRDSPLCS